MPDITEAQNRILDSAAYGSFRLAEFLRSRSDYECLFNRPWHGLNAFEAVAVIDRLCHSGFLLAEEVAGETYISLTSKGGEAWERIYEVNWALYYDYDVDTCPDGCIVVVVRSVSRGLASEAAGLLGRAFVQGVLGDPEIAVGFNWEWAPWKKHRVYYLARQKIAPGADLLPRSESEPFLRAELLRAEWKKKK